MEIYEIPDDEGLWWNENCESPQLIQKYDLGNGRSVMLAGENQIFLSEFQGKWQKVQPPIWPSRKN